MPRWTYAIGVGQANFGGCLDAMDKSAAIKSAIEFVTSAYGLYKTNMVVSANVEQMPDEKPQAKQDTIKRKRQLGPLQNSLRQLRWKQEE